MKKKFSYKIMFRCKAVETNFVMSMKRFVSSTGTKKYILIVVLMWLGYSHLSGEFRAFYFLFLLGMKSSLHLWYIPGMLLYSFNAYIITYLKHKTAILQKKYLAECFMDAWKMKGHFIPLWQSDAIWCQTTWSTLVQVMACCLTAPSHYLNQCWIVIKGALWHSPKRNFRVIAKEINLEIEFENHPFKITVTASRGQWVKLAMMMLAFSSLDVLNVITLTISLVLTK